MSIVVTNAQKSKQVFQETLLSTNHYHMLIRGFNQRVMSLWQ